VRYFAQSDRWRRLLVAACLPYLLLSVCAEAIHIERLDAGLPHANSDRQHLAAPVLHSEHARPFPCTACSWLRTQPKQQARFTVDVGVTADAVDSLPADPALPDSSGPRTPAGRGPPLQ